MKTTTQFNGTFTFLLAVVNTILLFTFLFGYGSNSFTEFYLFLLVIIPIQLGLITYFEKSDKKMVFKILTILSSILYVLLVIGILYLFALAQAFKN